MTLRELMKELRAIIKVHPEANEAQVWAYTDGECGEYSEYHFQVSYIGYDKHNHPARIKLEE